MPGYYRVFGSKGSLEVGSFNYEGLRLRASYRTEPGVPLTTIDEISPAHDPSHFVAELDHFSRCVIENRTPDTPGEEGLRDMRHIQSIYRAAGISMG
jgi:predicted dehydrogenase